MMKILKQLDTQKQLDYVFLIIAVVMTLIVIFIYIFLFIPTAEPQSLNSNSYDNYLFLSFIKARSTYKIHDANVLKTLLIIIAITI